MAAAKKSGGRSKGSASGKTTSKKKTSAKTQASKKGSSKNDGKEGLSPRVKAILYSAACVISILLLIIDGGFLWGFLRSVVFGIFGISALAIPALLAYMAYITTKGRSLRKGSKRMWLIAGIVFDIDCLIYLFGSEHFLDTGFFTAMKNLYLQSSSSGSVFTCRGGVLSGLLGYPMLNLIGDFPYAAICVLALAVLAMIVTNLSVSDVGKAAKKAGQKSKSAVGKTITNAKEKYRQKKEQEKTQDMYEDYYRDMPPEIQYNDGYYGGGEPSNYQNNAGYGGAGYGTLQGIRTQGSIDIPVDGVSVTKNTTSKKEDPGNLGSQLVDAVRKGNRKSNVSDIAKEISRKKESEAQLEAQKGEELAQGIENPFSGVSKTAIINSQEEHPQVHQAAEYKLPPVQLLRPPQTYNDIGAMEELQGNAKKLISTLESFGVKAEIVNICRGPSVTRYELSPAPGVKISKITNLADDIALNLAADGVRIEAPVPGKAAVGIEVPNKVVNTVSIRELIDSAQFRKEESKLTCVLGRDITGDIVTLDLAKMPHLLVAGTTGSGKSVCVNALLLSILYKATPEQVKLILIDPKMVEFSKYKGVPHLLIPVVADAKKAAGALNWAVSEMLQRYKVFSEFECKDIYSFNKLVDANLKFMQENNTDEEERPMEINGLPVPKEKFPQIVIAIDEFADLMMAAPGEVEESVCRLAQMARAAGMHLVIATQRPTVNVITGVIKSNIPSRIALKVGSNMDSRTILDMGGAEKLIGKGDMLYMPVGAAKPIRVQCCFASDDEIERVTGYTKKMHKEAYNAEIEEKIRRITAEEINTKGKADQRNGEAENDEEHDPLIEEAIKCVIEAGQASTSMLQRRIKVGYARAGRMIDEMEQMGVVGAYQGSKPREVLMTYQQWLERSNLRFDKAPEVQNYENSQEEEAP